MRRLCGLVAAVIVTICSNAQDGSRPKLVVGLVVDQMRWDYLYRYYDRYANDGGFKRLLSQGFSCENTWIPFTPTVTACGHASIYTGSVPAINGITGNSWWDNIFNRSVYCTEDTSVKTVGSNTTSGLQSPRNLFSSTITDELRLATNFRSKVIGIALKDRGSILPAGHSANAAFWYDNTTGNWITSTYYLADLPQWVKNFNGQKLVDKYYKEGWNTLYPLTTYVQSSPDENNYEHKPFGASAKGFPYDLSRFAGTSYSAILTTPFGNSLTAAFAKEAVTNEQLGADAITDFLTVSFSSPDYVGHSFGPNSVEAEDVFLRLDKELGDLLDFFDSKVGKDQYVVFLTADHGAAHVPGFLNEHKMPAGNFDFPDLYKRLNASLRDKFRKDGLIVDITNYQVFLNMPLIQSSNLKIEEIKARIINTLSTEPGIDRAFDINELQLQPMPAKVREMIANGYNPQRGGQIQLVLRPQWLEGFDGGGTTHGLWNPYDSHIPLIWFGWGIKQGKSNREVYMTDIAATLASLLRIQAPNGCIGKAIEEVMK